MNIEEAKHLKEHGFYEKNGKRITWADVKGDELKDAVLGFAEQFDMRAGAERAEGEAKAARITGGNSHCVAGVVVATHNHEEWLKDCCESIMRQTLRPHEVVIVDDNSNDGTAAVAQRCVYSLQAEGVRASYHRIEKGHQADTRNYGEAQLSPEVDQLVFVDGDDKCDPGQLAAMAAKMNDPRVAVAYPRMRHFGGRDETWPKYAVSLDTISETNRMPIASMIRREVFRQVGGFDNGLRVLCDWALWWDVLHAGWAVAPADTFYWHRVHPGQLGETIKIEDYRALLLRKARVLIVTAFDDKPYGRNEHLASIEAFDFPKDRLEISFIDNAGELSNPEPLWSVLDRMSFASAVHYRRVPGEPMTREILHGPDVNGHVASLYRRVPLETTCDFILVYENDAVALSNTVKELLGAFTHKTGAVGARCNSRSNGLLQAWNFPRDLRGAVNWTDSRLIPPPEDIGPIPVSATAWTCTMIRRSAWLKAGTTTGPPIKAFDGQLGYRLRQLGYEFLLHPGLVVKHMTGGGQYV